MAYLTVTQLESQLLFRYKLRARECIKVFEEQIICPLINMRVSEDIGGTHDLCIRWDNVSF